MTGHDIMPKLPIGPSWLHISMADLTALGGVAMLPIFTALAPDYLWIARMPMHVLLAVGAVGGGALIETIFESNLRSPDPTAA